MHPLLLLAGILAGSSLVFSAGIALGSALCNRRWAEKCARCQALIDRSRVFRTTPRDGGEPTSKLHVRPRKSP